MYDYIQRCVNKELVRGGGQAPTRALVTSVGSGGASC